MNLGCAISKTFVKIKVGFYQEVDCLWYNFFVFAIENDCPDHFALFKLSWVDHDLETRFVVFTNRDLFIVFLNKVRLPSST